MRVGQRVAEGVPVSSFIDEVRRGRDGNRISGDVKNKGDVVRATKGAWREVVMQVHRLSVCDGQVWSACAIVGERCGEVWP